MTPPSSCKNIDQSEILLNVSKYLEDMSEDILSVSSAVAAMTSSATPQLSRATIVNLQALDLLYQKTCDLAILSEALAKTDLDRCGLVSRFRLEASRMLLNKTDTSADADGTIDWF